MAVYVSNIVIEQGYDFSTTYELSDATTNGPLNMVGYGITAQLRKSYSSSSSLIFTSSIVDSFNGLIKIELSKEQTTSLKPGRHVYDIAIQPGGLDSELDRSKAIEGMALVRPGVTR
jgi:hypothetical protein